MSSTLEMLEADKREILAHLAIFPKDPYAHQAMIKIEEAILAATPPATTDRRNSMLRGIKPYVEKPKMVIADDVTELWTFGPPPLSYSFCAKEIVAKDVSLRFTFGVDYEMDQRWLEAERAKVAARLEEQRTVASPTPTAEPDRMMFPTMAFNLTSMHNLNYGTSRY